jgi:hypothetical protein
MGDRADLDEQLHDLAAGTTVLPLRARMLEVGLTDAPGLEQHHLHRQRLATNRRLDDAAVVEAHDPFILAKLRRHAQHSGLSAQVEKLKDVVNSELAKGSFDRHAYALTRGERMRCRSAAVRMSRRARRAYSVAGPSSTTFSQRAIASRYRCCSTRMAPS